jgi:TonB family protein
MKRIVSQGIFSSETAEVRSWRSYATSGVVHAAMIGALLLVTFPAVQEIEKPEQHVTLIAPPLPAYKPAVIQAPPVIHRPILKEAVVRPPKSFIPPPAVKPPQVKPQLQAKAPELKTPEPVVEHLPDVKLQAPPPPKPEVHTGVFAANEAAKGPRIPNELKVGGFGDPNGVHPSDNSQSARLLMAKVGSFDAPNGDGKSGGGGRGQNGAVRASGFGSPGDPNGAPGGTGTHGGVRTGGFGDGTAAAPAQAAQGHTTQPATTPVEILYKPKPAYTPEARSLRLEGKVSLEVVFLSTGAVKIVRIVHGLGHGLDETAQQAAMQVRFRPATRDGQPVDTNATIYITFELT